MEQTLLFLWTRNIMKEEKRKISELAGLLLRHFKVCVLLDL